jgi:hypothetical protein
VNERSAEHDPHDSSAQDEDEAKKAEAARLKRDREVDDFKWLLAHKQGRRVMWRMLGLTGVFRTPFVPGRDGRTEFNAGAQNVGQALLAEIHELCPEQYHAMVKEQQEPNARRTDKRS